MITARPDAEAAAHFGSEGTSAGTARRFVANTLQAWGQPELEEVAALLVSELVGNVVLHARTELEVVLRRTGSRVRVEVHDRSPRLPERKHYSLTSATGRGLVLVAELAQEWGADPTAQGKSVWFELDENNIPLMASAPAADFNFDDWDDLIEPEPR